MRSVAPMRTAKIGYMVISGLMCALGIFVIAKPATSAAVLGLIWINFLLEILIDVLLAPALYRVVSAVERRLGGKKSGGASSAVEKAEKKENPDEENAGTWDITE